MLPLATQDLPPLVGAVKEASGEEVLAKQPAGTGAHWWIKVRKDGLGSTQVREALARAVQRTPDIVSDAGSRDRRGVFTQWFSLPADAIDHPGPLRRAGAHNKMRVLEVVASHKAFGPEAVERIAWKLRLSGAAADAGYQKAKVLLHHLRVHGMPNYVGEDRLGPDGGWAAWGARILAGERLPEALLARGRTDVGKCLRAFQDAAFNTYVAQRLEDGVLDRALTGDLLRSRQGATAWVTDPSASQKRLDTWEAVILAPAAGSDFDPGEGDAAMRALAWVERLGMTRTALDRLKPIPRRPIRIQPAKVTVDPEGNDLVIACELPVDAHMSVLIQELTHMTPGASAP